MIPSGDPKTDDEPSSTAAEDEDLSTATTSSSLVPFERNAAASGTDVDAVLAKPLDAGTLIETIRRGLVDNKEKPAPPPVEPLKESAPAAPPPPSLRPDHRVEAPFQA